MRTRQLGKGPFLIFAAAVLWSFAGLASKFVPWGGMSIACVRGVIGALTIGALSKQWFFRPTKLVVLGALGTVTTSVLFMLANKMTTAANAIVLQYMAPVVVIILNLLLQKMKPAKLDLVMVSVTLLGIAFFFLDHLGSGKLAGDLLAILSSVTFAMVFYVNRLPGANATQASYLGCMLHILLLPALLNDPNFSLADPKVNLVVLLMGVLQMGLAYVLFAKGIASTPAVSASIIAMIEPVLNPLWVFLFLGEMPGRLALVGAAIVLIATTSYNIITSKQLEEKEHTAEA